MTDPENHDPITGDAADDDYAVGYKKPPKNGQFGKGNKSGKGRPKGAKNLKTMVNAALGMKAQAQIGGKTVKISKIELALHQLANKASKGDDKAMGKAIELQAQYGPQDDPSGPSPQEAAADMAALEAYFALKSGNLDCDGGDDGNDDG